MMSVNFRDRVLTRYQQQIAKGYHQCLLASSPADRFNQANNLAEAIEKTLAAVAHGGYRDRTRIRSIDLILAEGFTRPSIGTFHGLLSEILRVGPADGIVGRLRGLLTNAKESSPLAGFLNRSREFRVGNPSTRSKCNPQLFFDEYVQFRNKGRAHGAPSSQIYEQFNQPLMSALECVLDRLGPILELPLVSVDRIELDTSRRLVIYECTSYNGMAELPRREQRELGRAFLGSKQLYVVDDGEYLALSPLLSAVKNDSLGFLNEFRAGRAIEYLIHHSGALHLEEALEINVQEFFGLPSDVLLSDIKERNGITFNVPAPNVTRFIGRDNELGALRRALSRETFPLVTLWGWGGAGKTALAQKLAYELLSEDEESPLRFRYIVWTSAKKTELTADGIRNLPQSAVRVLSVLDEIVRVTGTGELLDASTPEELAMQVKEFFGSRDRVLVIVDNFETFEDSKGFAWDVFKDVAGDVRFLVTSRHKRGEAEQPVHLAGLSEDDALELLESEARERSAKPLLAAGPALRRRVVKECDCLPLAVKTVVGWVAKGVGVANALEGFTSVQGEGIHDFCFEESYRLLGLIERTIAFVLAMGGTPVTTEELHIALGRNMAAIEAATETLENLSIVDVIKTDDGIVIVEMPNLPGEYFRRRAGVEIAQETKAREALRAINKARTAERLGGGTVGPEIAKESKQARLAFRYAQLRQFGEADKYWALALEADPTNANVWARYGYYEAMLKDRLSKGLEALKKSLMLDGSVGHTWFVRGIVERKLRMCPESRQSFERARQGGEAQYLVESNIVLTAYEEAKERFRNGDRRGGKELCEEIVKRSEWAWATDSRMGRHNAILAVKLARSQMHLGKYRDALATVRRGLAGRPRDRQLIGLNEELKIRLSV